MPEARLRGALLAAALLLGAGASAGLPSRPSGPVLDLTGTLSQPEWRELDATCRELEQSGKGVLVVAIVPTLEGDSIEGYAVRLFREWGIGAKEKNDGVLLLVSIGDRKVRIETGYGVEAILPDGRCGEIIRREIIPRFKAGDPGGGILAGARAIGGVLGLAGPDVQRGPAVHDEAAILILLQVAALLLGPGLILLGWRSWPRGFGMLAAGAGALGFGFIATGIALLIVKIVLGLVGIGLARPISSAMHDRSLVKWPRGGRGTGGWWGGSGGFGGFGGGGGGSFGGFGGGFSGGGGASGSW